MCESQKIKRFFGTFISAEWQDMCFVFFDFQSKFCQSLNQLFIHLCCFIFILKHDYEIIRKAYQVCFSFQLWPDCLFKPQVQYIMQIYICQYWRNLSSLWSANTTFTIYAFFHDSCFKKSFDISQKILICYIMLKEFHQPFMVHIIKESFDITIQYIVDSPAHECLIDIAYCVMCTSSWSEPIRAVQKSRFIYFIQYICHDSLHQSVFIGWYSKWSHLPIAFWDIGSSYWLRTIRKCLHSFNELFQIFVQILFIVLFCYSVYPTGFLLHLCCMHLFE